ncbi:hypothetical protein SBY92_003506 [Candida maltosa Xu316]
MFYPVNKFSNKLRKYYNLYYYSSPLPVLSTGESIIFNTINLLILFISVYYTIFYVPHILTQCTEKFLYYITGHQINLFNLITSTFRLVAVNNTTQFVNNITTNHDTMFINAK